MSNDAIDSTVFEAIDTLQSHLGLYAESKGWLDLDRRLPEEIALVHSELSEALEEYRNGQNPEGIYYGSDGKPEGIPVELADVVIRVLQMSARWGIPLSSAIREKIAYNDQRPFRHGGKRI